MSTGSTDKVYQVPQQTLFNVVLLLIVGAAIAYFTYGRSSKLDVFAPQGACSGGCGCSVRHHNPYYPNGQTGDAIPIPPAPTK
jgi:hypothetical protein